MRRVNLFEFVELGKQLQNAASVDEKMEPIDAWLKIYQLPKMLAKLSADELAEFHVAGHDIEKLKAASVAIMERLRGKDENGDSYNEIGWSCYHGLSQALEAFNYVFSAECRSNAVYLINKVGIYATNDLIENAASKFSEDMRRLLGEDALDQFQEAARCLAFRVFTACGFHMMRAVEYVLIAYMKELCGRNFDSLNTNWGAYIAELEKISSSSRRKKASAETIDLLRHIKNNHRNPVMHADFVLTEQEAMDIFDLGAVVMSHLAEEHAKIKSQRSVTSVAPLLAANS